MSVEFQPADNAGCLFHYRPLPPLATFETCWTARANICCPAPATFLTVGTRGQPAGESSAASRCRNGTVGTYVDSPSLPYSTGRYRIYCATTGSSTDFEADSTEALRPTTYNRIELVLLWTPRA